MVIYTTHTTPRNCPEAGVCLGSGFWFVGDGEVEIGGGVGRWVGLYLYLVQFVDMDIDRLGVWGDVGWGDVMSKVARRLFCLFFFVWVFSSGGGGGGGGHSISVSILYK